MWWCLWEEGGVPVPALFWGAGVRSWAHLCQPLGCCSRTTSALLMSICATRSNVRVSWSSHSFSFKPWRCVAGYLSSFLAGNFPNVFQYFCCSFLGARAYRCTAQPEGLEPGSPAASSDGCGGCKPRPWERRSVQR